jgi:hypothetical protein
MRLIGYIRQLQIQIDALKKGEGPDRIYDIGGLQLVPMARLSVDGVAGLQENQELFDVHHKRHNRSKHHPNSAISINFTQNYGHMRGKFGADLTLGCAGENLIIELVEGIDLNALMAESGASMVIETDEGQQGRLSGFKVARPCVPFTKFVLNAESSLSASKTKEALQFLDGGMRGYYCRWTGEPLVAKAGDKVLFQA